MHRTLIAVVSLAACLATPLWAQVIRKHGTCPDRYHGVGETCEPYQNACPVFEKGRAACPSGSHQSGDGYCVAYC